MKALEIKPGYVDAVDTLGWICYQSGDLEKAFGLIQNAIFRKPNHPVINYHLGMILHAKGRYKEAEIALKKALVQKADYRGRDEAQKTLERVRAALKTEEAADISVQHPDREIITGGGIPGDAVVEDSPFGSEPTGDIFDSPHEKKDPMENPRNLLLPERQ
jgi:tetratricopeptide (TPR) repeat protein